MTILDKQEELKNKQMNEAKNLMSKMTKEQALFFCEELSKRLPNINNTPPIHRMSEDNYMQFWALGVTSALKSL